MRKCEICDKAIDVRYHTAKYCEDCSEGVRHAQVEEWGAKYADELDAWKREWKRTYTPKPRVNNCVTCGADISHRFPNTKYCKPCRKKRGEACNKRMYHSTSRKDLNRWKRTAARECLAKAGIHMTLAQYGWYEAQKLLVDELVERNGNACHWCKEPLAAEYHPSVTQVTLGVHRRDGGALSWENTVVAHNSCIPRRIKRVLGLVGKP